MNINELTLIANLDYVIAWRIKRCIDPVSDSTKQPWERTGGVPLASSDWGLLETEWDPARGCSMSPSPCACQTAAIASSTAEGEFACKAIAARGIEGADEVLIADCLTNLGYPSAVAVQVPCLLAPRSLPPCPALLAPRTLPAAAPRSLRRARRLLAPRSLRRAPCLPQPMQLTQ